MSTEIIESFGDHSINLTQYSGGIDKGICLQITGLNCDNKWGYVGLTVSDAKELIRHLNSWVIENEHRT